MYIRCYQTSSKTKTSLEGLRSIEKLDLRLKARNHTLYSEDHFAQTGSDAVPTTATLPICRVKVIAKSSMQRRMRLFDPTSQMLSPLYLNQWQRGLGTLRLDGCGEGVVWTECFWAW